MKDKDRYVIAFPEIGWPEKGSINLYTESTSYSINGYLRTNQNSSNYDLVDLQMYSYYISSGLIGAKTKFQDTAFRGISLTSQQIAEYEHALKNRDTMILKGFSSTTNNAAIAYEFADRAGRQKGTFPVIITITSKTAVDITRLSIYSHETEILFNKDLEVRVLAVDFESGKYHIDLDEV